MRRTNNPVPRKRRGENGSTIVESMLSIIVILLILFGLLQLFHLSLAQVIADYSSFRGARSASVGFTDYLSSREAKIKSIPASGYMTSPLEQNEFESPYAQFYFEQTAIERFMTGTQYLDYEYWNQARVRHTNYHCPFYGRTTSGAVTGCLCASSSGVRTSFSCTRTEESVTAGFSFSDYPLNVPLHDAFTNTKSLDIEGQTKLTNHATNYLE